MFELNLLKNKRQLLYPHSVFPDPNFQFKLNLSEGKKRITG
jgi:hypothetical protein